MAYSSITYADKVENNGATPAGRFGADDLNEIKTVTNANGADFDGRIDALEAGGGGINNLTSSGHVGDGTTVTFPLSFTPQTEVPQAFVVGIDGVLQSPIDAYTVSTTTDAITFSSAPPVNAEIVVSTANVLTGTDISASTIIATGSTTTRLLTDRFADTVNVKDFGAVGDGVTDDTVAIQAALDSLDGVGGVVVVPAGKYKCTASLLIPSGVILQGAGIGMWDTVFHNRPKQWSGTSLLFAGAGAKTESFDAITDQPVTGGWRVDGGDTYKLSNWMNSDASGTVKATPKLFSAAVTHKQVSEGETFPAYWGMSNIRIAPWMGADGYSDYSDIGNTSLGDDWDVGVYSNGSQYESFNNVQVVGYWREAAILRVQSGLAQYTQGERGSFRGVQAQGYRGLVLRADDYTPTTNVTSSTLEIPWHDSHFWPTSGYFELTGGADYQYTGLSYAGDKLTFTGVTPALPAGNTLMRPNKRGTGIAGSIFENSYVSGLCHVSGQLATSLGFSEAGAAFEMSGFPLRGYVFNNFKTQNANGEPFNAFIGACDDAQFLNCQFETGVVIASPRASDQVWATYAGGVETTDLRMISQVWSSSDKSLFTPRTYFDLFDTFNPLDSFAHENVMTTQVGRQRVFKKAAGQSLFFRDADNSNILSLYDSKNVESAANITSGMELVCGTNVRPRVVADGSSGGTVGSPAYGFEHIYLYDSGTLSNRKVSLVNGVFVVA